MSRRKTTATPAPEASAPEPTAPEITPATPEEAPTVLVGRLCADPVLRKTKSGISVATIRIAVNPPEGEATFHNVVVWKATAEAICRYLKKGRLVEVTGRAQERTWTDKDGNERTTPEVSAFRVQFLSDRTKSTAAEPALAA
jgi:single-strand DNA-binding protein